MTETSAQSDQAGDSQDQLANLENQLDVLLRQASGQVASDGESDAAAADAGSTDTAAHVDVHEQEAGESVEADTSTEPGDSIDDAIDEQIDHAIDAVSSATDETNGKPDEPQDEGDALAAQIQALLDEARTGEAVGDSGGAEKSFTANFETTFEPPDDEAIAAAQEANRTITDVPVEQSSESIDAPATSQTDTTGADTSHADAQTKLESDDLDVVDPDTAEAIQQIDELLADQADDAVSGEFETVADVIQQEQQGSAAAVDDSNAASMLQPDSSDAKDDAVVPSNAPAYGAAAQDVAKELDSQPELDGSFEAPEPFATEATQATSAPTAGAATVDQAAPPSESSPAGGGPFAVVRGMLGLINAPVLMLSPEWRDTVGWVALGVAVPGFFFFLYSLLFG